MPNQEPTPRGACDAILLFPDVRNYIAKEFPTLIEQIQKAVEYDKANPEQQELSRLRDALSERDELIAAQQMRIEEQRQKIDHFAQLISDGLDIVKEQAAEIEKLKAENNKLRYQVANWKIK